MKNCFFLLLAIFLVSCNTPQVATSSTVEPVEFIVLQLNDVYEIAPLEGGKAGGLARVATVRQELLRENPNVISVLAGDFLSPSCMKASHKSNLRSFHRPSVSALSSLRISGLCLSLLGGNLFAGSHHYHV